MAKKLQISPEEHLFISNIPLLVKHREEILSSAEMSGVITGVSNGLAYTGRFKPATVGAYLDWWANHPEMSRDKEGRLIWNIQGSQLSGVHACQTVDDAGNSHLAELNNSLVNVARSFLAVAKKFSPSEMTLATLVNVFKKREAGRILDIEDDKEFVSAVNTFLADYSLDGASPELVEIVNYFKEVAADPERDVRETRRMSEYVKNNPGTPIWHKKN